MHKIGSLLLLLFMLSLKGMAKFRHILQLPMYAMHTSKLNYCTTFRVRISESILRSADNLVREKNKVFEIQKHSSEIQIRRAVEASFKKYAWHTFEIEGIQATTSQLRKAKEAFNFIQTRFRFGRLDDHVILQTNGIFTDDKFVKYRSENVIIRDPTGKINICPDYEEVPSRMRKLISFMNNSTAIEMNPVIIGPMLKAFIVQIHPFMDGNGRTSRAFMNDILVKNDFPFVCIPAEEVAEYYCVMNDFAEKEDIAPYFKYIHYCIERSLLLFRQDLENLL